MKKICAVILLSALTLSFASAEDWAAVPPGKARVLVYGDYFGIDVIDVQFQVDGGKAFSYKATQKNAVLDLTPGRHSIRLTYPMLIRKPLVIDAGFFLVEGDVVYLQFTLSGENHWLHMVTQAKFEQTAKNRPSIRDPFAGGQE